MATKGSKRSETLTRTGNSTVGTTVDGSRQGVNLSVNVDNSDATANQTGGSAHVSVIANIFQFSGGSQPGPELSKFLQSVKGNVEQTNSNTQIMIVQNQATPVQATEPESRILDRESISSLWETMPKRTKLDHQGPYGFIEEGPDEDSIPGQRFGLQVKLPAVFDEKSPFQHIEIFDTKAHGRALVLDGVVQFTEADEFAYHEMLAHVPLLNQQVGKLDGKRVLLIGAGDGGALREICKHPTVRLERNQALPVSH